MNEKVQKIPVHFVLNNRYVILRFLGEGGLSFNYLAMVMGTKQLVVVKQTKRHQHLTGDKRAKKIFADILKMLRENGLPVEVGINDAVLYK